MHDKLQLPITFSYIITSLGSHTLVFWEEEGLTSILKASQVVEPLQPKKGSKATMVITICQTWSFFERSRANFVGELGLTNFVQISGQFRSNFGATSNELQCNFERTSMQLRTNFNATSNELQCNFERTSGQLRTTFGATSLELKTHFVRTSIPLRANFVRSTSEVREERTSYGNIIFAATVSTVLEINM